MELLIISITLVTVLLISMVWTNSRGAPWVPTSISKVNKMLDLAEVKPDDLVYDLGCGDGRIVVTAAQKYHARAVGIELDPFRWLWCQGLIVVLGLQDRVQVHFGDFFKQDLSQADVVTCYLLPETNRKLEEKLLRELKPGTRVVSNTFLFPGIKEKAKNGKIRLYIFSPENRIETYIKDQLQALN